MAESAQRAVALTNKDQEFVAELRAAIERFFGAVDQWETAYQKYYRLPGFAARISDDLEAEHGEYCRRRRELREMLPRARRLCLKHGLREPFSGLERISLGRYSPQERTDSAIGRNERSLVAKCLLELHHACQEWEAEPQEQSEPRPEPAKRSFLQRFVNFFY
jgi:hypothetical protein